MAHDLEEALAAAAPCEEVLVIGGAHVYEQVIDRADRLYLTLVDADVPGDACFPAYEHLGWREVSRYQHPPDARNPFAYAFVTLDREGGAHGGGRPS